MILRFFEKIVFIIFLLVQGLYVKWRIVKLPEADGPREGQSGNPDNKALSFLIIGDSAAAGVGAEHQDEALLGNLTAILSDNYLVNWRLWAKSGETTTTKLRKLADLSTPYDYVVVSLGVNDITSPIRQAAWLQQQTALIDLLKERSQPQQIILGSLPPIKEFFALPNPLRYLLARRAHRFTAALKEMTKADDTVVVLDLPDLNGEGLAMASDGFHPGPTVYKAWAAAITEIIQADQKQSSTKA